MIRNKIGLKLTIVVVLMTLLIIGIFAWVSIRSYRDSLLSEVERHAVQISQTMVSGTEYDMLLNEPARIHETIKRLGRQTTVERIRIMNKAGEVTYSTDEREIGKTVDRGVESCNRCHFTEPPLERLELRERTRVFRRSEDSTRLLGVITPIYNQASCWTASCHAHPQAQSVLGVFDVILPLDSVEAEIQRSGIEVVVFAATSVLSLSLLIGFFVRRWVDIPVKHLVEATRHVAGGDLSKTINEARGDELGTLARSFNHMTRKLSEARTQLVQSDKMASLGRLAAGVAHEINNPLTGVLTYSSLLLKRMKGQPEVEEDLQVIVRETIRCRGIVKSLLDFARQSVPKKSAADMNEILSRAVSVVERQLSLDRIRVVKVFAEHLPKVVVDANQMEQVFVNLIVNAADAIGPKGGDITLRSAAARIDPSGTIQVKRAQCPKRHSLISGDMRFEGKPALRVKARTEDGEGFLFIDPIYGHGARRDGYEWDARRKVQFLCPECSSSLMAEGKACPRCGAPVYTFEVPPKGMLEGCTSAACGWQKWDAVDAGGHPEYVEVQVCDTGCGISPENLEKIYEPFFSTKGAKGTGLGLAVIWGILDNHEGMIDVSSKLGEGTTFSIRIPVTS